MIERVTIVGTGLIGASIGLALREAGFEGDLCGVDTNAVEREEALEIGAINRATSESDGSGWENADLIILAVPVLAILDWMQKLSPVLKPHQLVTDTGSTKLDISVAAARLFNTAEAARFLPGHPMAGKESGGAALAEATLFQNAMWLFTPVAPASPIEEEWRAWVAKFGCRTMDLDAGRHDQICAWVSHLPQMVATAMSAMFADEFAHAPELADDFEAIGGRALREMTRLGASPYSMWRDVAFTNTKPLAGTLFALEQRLAHMRENLRTPELREEFQKANDFRRKP
jgi:prephenate dehydrogenase